jgi:hypothetical protein
MATATMESPPPELHPLVLRAGWLTGRKMEFRSPSGERMGAVAVYSAPALGLEARFSLDTMENGRQWLHLSVSHRSRYPTWDELREVKNMILGRDRAAYQVLPREADYVNVHPNCFHLWSPLSDDPFPSEA